jgi:hypothetical protein
MAPGDNWEAPNLTISYKMDARAIITNDDAIYTKTVVEALTAAFRSFLKPLIVIEVTNDIKIKTRAKPNLPFSGVTPTITIVLITVIKTPRRSVIKSLGVSFHGYSGLAINVL